jgi:hypothetical protein
MIMRYHHCGIPTKKDFEGAIYLPKFKMHVSDHLATPYAVQWMRFDEDCPLPDLVKTVSHVAFEVDDLEAAIRGKNVIISPINHQKECALLSLRQLEHQSNSCR